MSKLIKCRTCGGRFDPNTKNVKAGYVDECRDCSLESGDLDRKYIGRSGAVHKGANIEIFRSDLKNVKKILKREAGAGFAPNIGISHPVAVQKFEDKKK